MGALLLFICPFVMLNEVVIYPNKPPYNFVLHLALLSSAVLKSIKQAFNSIRGRVHAEEQSYLKNWVKADVFAIVDAHLNSWSSPIDDLSFAR